MTVLRTSIRVDDTHHSSNETRDFVLPYRRVEDTAATGVLKSWNLKTSVYESAWSTTYAILPISIYAILFAK
jgi:hypothetical protein